MPREMIKDRQVTAAPWELVTTLPEGARPTAGQIVPLADWLRLDAAGADLDGVGVIVAGDEDLAPVRALLARLPVVALPFPRFADGRCYSHARRLRAHWGFEGDILAFGDVLRDQLLYMSRSGFNAFYLREDQDLRASLAAFSLYTEFYQYH